MDLEGSIVAQGKKWNAENRLRQIDWPAFYYSWLQVREAKLQDVRTGRSGFRNTDQINEASLEALGKSKELAGFWDRLAPWPDVAPGIRELRKNYKVGTLSNGSIRNQEALQKFTGLPWDYLFSAEHMKSYKPDRKVYLWAAKQLKLEPHEILLVAAHEYDLDAARRVGYQTAFVQRTKESSSYYSRYDIQAQDFLDLAHQLNRLASVRP